jgi:hypothetical protein
VRKEKNELIEMDNESKEELFSGTDINNNQFQSNENDEKTNNLIHENSSENMESDKTRFYIRYKKKSKYFFKLFFKQKKIIKN